MASQIENSPLIITATSAEDTKIDNPMLLAASDEQWDLVERLIKAGADVNAIAANGKYKGVNVLWLAADGKQWDLIERLIKAGADINATPAEGEDKGKTILWLAAYRQQWDLVEQLIEAGADINAMATEGEHKGKTILWFAVLDKKEDVVKRLIKFGANVNATATKGPGKNVSVLWLAALRQQWNVVEQLIEAGTNINAIAEGIDSGINVLWLAANDKQWDLVERLIKAGADINAVAAEGEHKGKTILWLAAFHQQWDLVERLIKAGTDINATAAEGVHKGKTVLWWAASDKQWDMVEQLIKAGADINATAAEGKHKGKTALWWIAFHQQWDLVERLIKAGADIKATAVEGEYKGKTVAHLIRQAKTMTAALFSTSSQPDKKKNTSREEATVRDLQAKSPIKHKQSTASTSSHSDKKEGAPLPPPPVKKSKHTEQIATDPQTELPAAVNLSQYKAKDKIEEAHIIVNTFQSLDSFPPYSDYIQNIYPEQQAQIRTLITEIRDTLIQAITSLAHHCKESEKHRKRHSRLQEYETDIEGWRDRIGSIMTLSKRCQDSLTAFNQALAKVGTLPTPFKKITDDNQLIFASLMMRTHQLSTLKKQLEQGENELNTEIRYLRELLVTIQYKMKQDNEGTKRKKKKKIPLALSPGEALEATFREFHTLIESLNASPWSMVGTPIPQAMPLPSIPSTSSEVELSPEEHSDSGIEEDEAEPQVEPVTVEPLLADDTVMVSELPPKKKDRNAAFYERKSQEAKQKAKQRQYDEEKLRQQEELRLAEEGFVATRPTHPLKKEPLIFTTPSTFIPGGRILPTPSFSLAAQREVELAELRQAIELVTSASMGYPLKACILFGAIVRVCDLVSAAYQATDQQFSKIAMDIKRGCYSRYASMGTEQDYHDILDIATSWGILVLKYLREHSVLNEEVLTTQSQALVSIVSLGKTLEPASGDKRLYVGFSSMESRNRICRAANHLHECLDSPFKEPTTWIFQWCCGVIGKELTALRLAAKDHNIEAQTVLRDIIHLIQKPGINSILQTGARARHPLPRIDEGSTTVAIANILTLQAGLNKVSSALTEEPKSEKKSFRKG